MLRHYVKMTRCIFLTDHSALRWMLHMDAAQNGLDSWRLPLSKFYNLVKTRPGAAHHAADTMSRLTTQTVDTRSIPDVVLRDPVGDGDASGEALRVRRPAGVGDADDDRRGRNGGAGTGTAGRPVRAGASLQRDVLGRRARLGAPVAAARGRRRRQPTGSHAAAAARCARNGHSPSSLMIASGDLICMEGIICLSW